MKPTLKDAAAIARKFLLDEWVHNRFGMWTYMEKSSFNIRVAIPNHGYVSSMMYCDHLHPVIRHQEVKPNSEAGELVSLGYPVIGDADGFWRFNKKGEWEHLFIIQFHHINSMHL